jgi:hypothetical protein
MLRWRYRKDRDLSASRILIDNPIKREMKPGRHYKDIPFWENRARLKLLRKFHGLVSTYFDNSVLNMVTGVYNEKAEAAEAKKEINGIIKDVYTIISSADIKTYTASISTVTLEGRGRNIDLILNIFNLGRNNIAPEAAIDYVDRAIAVYKGNILASLMRIVNPFFWLSAVMRHRSRARSRTDKPSLYDETPARSSAQDDTPFE